MASVKVFGSPTSAEVARVLMCLFEKEVEFQLIRVDAYRGTKRMPQYLKLQPQGEALTFEDESLTLSDSRGILRHISHKYAKQGNPLPDWHGRAGAGVHRAVAADGGAELRRAQRRDGLQPRLPAAHPAQAERQRQRRRVQRQGRHRRQQRRRVQRQARCGRVTAGGEPDQGERAEGGGDAEAVRAEEEGPGEAAGHLRAAPGGGHVPGRRQLHHRRPVAPALRGPPRLRPALPPHVRVPQERQQVVARRLRPRHLEVRQDPAAPAVHVHRRQRQERPAGPAAAPAVVHRRPRREDPTAGPERAALLAVAVPSRRRINYLRRRHRRHPSTWFLVLFVSFSYVIRVLLLLKLRSRVQGPTSPFRRLLILFVV
uniref:glutathione transferase n=1 Tax=Zea mays TaxID=4577 RepID=Q9FQC8_MAIZE|nr:glutathione S-transferase GST 11 [Zea mays]